MCEVLPGLVQAFLLAEPAAVELVACPARQLHCGCCAVSMLHRQNHKTLQDDSCFTALHQKSNWMRSSLYACCSTDLQPCSGSFLSVAMSQGQHLLQQGAGQSGSVASSSLPHRELSFACLPLSQALYRCLSRTSGYRLCHAKRAPLDAPQSCPQVGRPVHRQRHSSCLLGCVKPAGFANDVLILARCDWCQGSSEGAGPRASIYQQRLAV